MMLGLMLAAVLWQQTVVYECTQGECVLMSEISLAETWDRHPPLWTAEECFVRAVTGTLQMQRIHRELREERLQRGDVGSFVDTESHFVCLPEGEVPWEHTAFQP